jgi:hypothetical protein
MIEKYGVDLSTLPVTDEQIKELNKFAKEYEMPKNREEAEKLIEKFAKES